MVFHLYEKDYAAIVEGGCEDDGILQLANFMTFNFNGAGPAGSLILSLLSESFSELIPLLDEALALSLNIGCLQTSDILLLKSYALFKLAKWEECEDVIELVT